MCLSALINFFCLLHNVVNSIIWGGVTQAHRDYAAFAQGVFPMGFETDPAFFVFYTSC